MRARGPRYLLIGARMLGTQRRRYTSYCDIGARPIGARILGPCRIVRAGYFAGPASRFLGPKNGTQTANYRLYRF